MLTEIPHVFRDNNRNTKTKNVLDKWKGEIPFPEKWDYTRIKDSATRITASAHLHNVIEQDQGGKAAGISVLTEAGHQIPLVHFRFQFVHYYYCYRTQHGISQV